MSSRSIDSTIGRFTMLILLSPRAFQCLHLGLGAGTSRCSSSTTIATASRSSSTECIQLPSNVRNLSAYQDSLKPGSGLAMGPLLDAGKYLALPPDESTRTQFPKLLAPNASNIHGYLLVMPRHSCAAVLCVLF
ncbi:hypothetical protein LZ30DRAFT_711383 [Colletotrichum cereale]|nr:hypothetical protein LZ30DRAFT_711383 [Colletotrichum cereale]